MRKIQWGVWIIGALALVIASLCLWCVWPVASRPMLVEVRIVHVSSTDSWARWGSSGYTVIELPSGERRDICGVRGAVGDRFKYDVSNLVR
jgi:hypothetical protein